MNKIIEAGDTLSAGLKIGGAVLAVYAVFKLYQFGSDVSSKVDGLNSQIDSAANSANEFATKTINPTSNDNFINQSIVGKTLTPVFNSIFDFVGVGK